MLLPLYLHLKVCSPVAVTIVTMVEHALTTPVTAHLSPLVFTVNTLVVSMLCTIGVSCHPETFCLSLVSIAAHST